MMENKVGVLLTNIGTPDHPTPASVRRYLKQFLSDRRVVEIPRWLWWPILYGLILPFRAKKSAKLYQAIWTEQGSPLLQHSLKLRDAIQKKLQIPVALGMHYSRPSIADALTELKNHQVKKIIILPLYPQYSATTTASTFDHVASVLNTWREIPELHLITDYADHPLYIKALAESIREIQTEHLPEKIIFSFHGIPKKFVESGDPYRTRCETTVQLLAKELDLAETHYSLTFQSRLGRAEWLQPYTDKTLRALPTQGVTDIQVICPGFAVDCLETLEEIALQGKAQFLAAGGTRFQYIQALNDSEAQVQLLVEIIKNTVQNPSSE